MQYLSVNYHIDGITTCVTKTLDERDQLLATGEWFGSFDEARACLAAQLNQAKQDITEAEKPTKKKKKAS